MLTEKNEKSELNLLDYTKITNFYINVRTRLRKVAKRTQFTDYGILYVFKPYLIPLKTIDNLCAFYTKFTKAQDELDDIQNQVNNKNIRASKRYKFNNINKLDEIQILDKIKSLEIAKKELSDYLNIQIVRILLEEFDTFIEEINCTIRKIFLLSLTSLPKIDKESVKYCHYLLKIDDSKQGFLREYSNTIYELLFFFGIENSFEALVQQTTNLTEFFTLVIDTNKKFINDNRVNYVNAGLLKLMVLNLKDVIIKRLNIIKKDKKFKNLPNLIRLYGNIKHSRGYKIKEIDVLCDLKTNIMTEIHNCFVQFFIDLEYLDKPNSKYIAEKSGRSLKQTFDAFKVNEHVLKIWFKKYGKAFGVYEEKNLVDNFAEKYLRKIDNLANELEGIPKNVYLINNYYLFKNHMELHNKKPLKKIINSHLNNINGWFKVEIENEKNRDPVKYIKNTLKIYGGYQLPRKMCNKIRELTKEYTLQFFPVNAKLTPKVNEFLELIDKTFIYTKNVL